ncbi:hypothetical protein CAEBREN_20756 [Caenorhabditis brenneri]|uniref:Uncharacterized protein n=1 Tax=Caenorhabditis brenneri TaxID=135651 RepID=G0NJA9_CAEBE|nr:hypothetical protein CAEBREN_20756 [Caenorhabditis brenneri]
MIIPCLKTLCAHKTSDHIKDGNLSLSFRLPIDLSNRLHKDHESFLHLDYSKLQVTNIDVGEFEIPEDFERLSNFQLKSLRIGVYHLWNLENRFEGQEHKSLIDCFCECLASSRSSLNHIMIPIKDSLDKYWLEKFLDYFVNLRHLDILHATLGRFDADSEDDIEIRKFPSMKRIHPGVEYLNISNTLIYELNGISKLPNVTVLSMRNLEFESVGEIEELFSLRHLKFLDVSHRIGSINDPVSSIVNLLIASGNSLPELNELDCSNTVVTREELDELFRLNPTIEKIALHYTQAADYSKEGVTVFSARDIESALLTLKRYPVKDKNFYTMTIIDKMLLFLEAENLDFAKNETLLLECLEELLVNAGEFLSGRDWDMTEDSSVFQLVILLSERYMEHLSPEKIRHIFAVLIYTPGCSTFGYGILSVPNILDTPGLDIASLFQKVLNFFSSEPLAYTELHFNMVDVLKQLHAKTTPAIRNNSTGKERCISFLYTMLYALGQADHLEMPLCKLIAKTNKLMIFSMESELDLQIAVDLINRLGEQSHPHMKLFHLNAIRFVIYRLKLVDVEELAARVDLKVIMKCLLGDLRRPYRNTDEYLDRKLAFSAMEVLVYLYQFVGEDEFIGQLREITQNGQYYHYQIPVVQSDEKTDKQTFITCRESNLDDWRNSINKYIITYEAKLQRANLNKYRYRRMDTGCFSVRYECLQDPSADRNYRW